VGTNNFLEVGRNLTSLTCTTTMVMHRICLRHFLMGGESFSRGRIPPLSYGPGHQMNLGMQKSHCRLDWYMSMYSERLLVRFLLDILKFSLVGLDNSAWEFD